jgi:SAM-dependent methyltransferase
VAPLERHRQDWEELAEVDPLWAILATPEARGGRWDTEEFFATGEQEVAHVLSVAEGLGFPKRHERALDFGCGVGRLTRALAERFDDALGIDISREMVRLAAELNAGRGARFEVNGRPDLGGLESGTFDFVYSSLVLQHLPQRELIRSYVGEFVRVLRDGGVAVFQAFSYLPPARRLQPRRRAYAALHRLGVSHEVLQGRLGLVPIRLTAISEDEVRAAVSAHGGVVEHVEVQPEQMGGVRSLRYYVRTG